MQRSIRLMRPAILLMLLALTSAAGCACYHAHCFADDHPWVGSPSVCFGYYPTCWRPWPAECPPCPPFTLVLPPDVESVPPQAESNSGAPAGTGDVLPIPLQPMTPKP